MAALNKDCTTRNATRVSGTWLTAASGVVAHWPRPTRPSMCCWQLTVPSDSRTAAATHSAPAQNSHTSFAVLSSAVSGTTTSI